MDPAHNRSAVLVGITPIARDTNLYSFELDAPLPFEAGQFVNMAIPGATPRGERSYSVWSDPAEPGRLSFAIKLFEGGQASEYLRTVTVGTSFDFRGPYGHFGLRPPEPEGEQATHTHWFLATSTGLAPFHAMLCTAAQQADPRRFRLLFGCRDEGDIFALDALDRFMALLDFDYAVCLSKPEGPTRHRVGRITAHLPTPDPASRYYLCGNGAMITEAKDLLKAGGVDRKRIHYEKYW